MTDLKYKLLIEAEADTKGIGKMQKELSALYKEQKKATSTAATALVKQKTKTTELAKLTGPDAAKKQLASKKEELRLDKQLTAEVTKQVAARKQLIAANKQFARTTFRGGLRGALGMRQSGDPDGPNWRSRMGSAVGGAFRTGIGLAGGGLTALAMSPIAALGAQYQAYASFSRSAAGLSHMGAGMPFARRGGLQGGFGVGGDLQNLGDRGAALGYMPEESVAALQAMSRATGSSSAMANTDLGMGASRLTGQSMDEITNFMAEQRRGAGSSGRDQRREFQQTLQLAVAAGMDASTLPEYMEGIQTILQGTNQRGGTNSAAHIAAIMAMAQRSGIAGMSGARGVATMSGVDAGVRGAGGIDLGLRPLFNALALQEAGLGRGESYSGAAGRLQQGIFGSGGIGVTGVRHIIQSAQSTGLAGSDLNQGVVDAGYAQTQQQASEIIRMLNQQGTDAELTALLNETTQSELDVQRQIANHTAEIAALLGGAGHGGVAGAAYTAMQNVHSGADNAGPLEELQHIMQEFVDGPMHALVHSGLELLPGVLRTLTTSVSGLARVLGSPAAALTSGPSDTIFDQVYAETQHGLHVANRLDAGETIPRDEMQAALDELNLASQQTGEAYADPAIRFRRQGLEGRAASDQELERQRQQGMTSLIAALNRLITAAPPADPAVGLLADGVRAAPPGSVRTSVSSTGTGR